MVYDMIKSLMNYLMLEVTWIRLNFDILSLLQKQLNYSPLILLSNFKV